jgi:hypothetical protein
MNEETLRKLKKVIECGKNEQFSELDRLFPNGQSYQLFLQLIQESIKTNHGGTFLHYYDMFALLAESYDFEDLVNLIKGLTIVENNKRMGSASPVIGLYPKLVEKAKLLYLRTGDKSGIYLLIKHLSDEPNKAIEDITKWILNNSENIYLPFGISTVHSRTITGIKIELENWMQRKQEAATREEKQRKENDERNYQRRIEIENYDKEHQSKTVKQREYREYLKSLGASQLLRAIASDNERSIYFYADELNAIELVPVAEDDKEIIRNILNRFKQFENGHLKRLKAKLTSITE